MLTPAGPEFAFAPEFVPAPPTLAADPPDPPLSAAPFAEPPGAPDLLPSGEIATRAERFPCGTLTSGAGGAGDAEIAIKRCKLASPGETAAPISGAAPASFCDARRSATGFDIGLTGNCGCESVAVEATMSSGPVFRSAF